MHYCIVNVEFNKILFGKPAGGLPTLLDGGRITSRWFTDSLASNSQTYILSLMNNLSKSTNKDFDLVVQEPLASATPTVKVHKIILSATSPVFRDALLALPPGDDSKLTLDLRNITEAGLQAFVNFMYGSLNKVDLVTYRDELFAISSKFAVTTLYQCCMDLYRVDLNSRNLLSTLKLAAVVGSTDLQTLCIDFLSLNIEDIKGVESFIREGYCSAQGFDSCCKVKDVKAEEVKDVKVKREFDSHCQVKDVKAEEVKDVKVKRKFDSHCQVKDVKAEEVKDVKVKREFDSHCDVKLKRPKYLKKR